MKKYQELPIEVVIPSHGYVSDRKLLENNLKYLEFFPEIDSDMYTDDNKKAFLSGTIANLKTVGNDYFSLKQFDKALIYFEKIAQIDNKEKLLDKEAVKELKASLKKVEHNLK